MAARTGAGTGVVVSLVVFVLSTFFLLVLAIVFYAKSVKAEDEAEIAQKQQDAYIKSHEISQDYFQQLKANAQNQSMAAHQRNQMRDFMGYVAGNQALSFDEARQSFRRYGVSEGGDVLSHLRDVRDELQEARNQVDRLNASVQDREDQIAQLEAQIDQAEQAHQQEIQQLSSSITQYRDMVQEIQTGYDELQRQYQQGVDNAEIVYQEQIANLEDELNVVNRSNRVLEERLDELKDKLEVLLPDATNPAELVDGQIIDIGANDRVFIDLGRSDRLTLGTTFEVYSDQSQLLGQADDERLPRGKASLQVIKLAQDTATCVLTRTTPGNPVVRGDVIANAVYDPDFEFKFLVHGKFDTNDDGIPTDQEAEYLRTLVERWGGQVVPGDEIPGDLDFLVLGEEPPMPLNPGFDADEVEMDVFLRRRIAHETYNRLKQQAIDARIPVLNDNRFLILIGHTNR